MEVALFEVDIYSRVACNSYLSTTWVLVKAVAQKEG